MAPRLQLRSISTALLLMTTLAVGAWGCTARGGDPPGFDAGMETPDAGTDAGPEPTCEDGLQNQDETDVDCGGAVCPGCGSDMDCLTNADCIERQCYMGTCVSYDTGYGLEEIADESGGSPRF